MTVTGMSQAASSSRSASDRADRAALLAGRAARNGIGTRAATALMLITRPWLTTPTAYLV